MGAQLMRLSTCFIAHLFRDCRSSQVLDLHTVPDAGNLKRATSVKRKALALHHGKDDWELRRAHPARGGLRSRHLDETLDLEAMARVAHLSPYHFHRIYRGVLGE